LMKDNGRRINIEDRSYVPADVPAADEVAVSDVSIK